MHGLLADKTRGRVGVFVRTLFIVVSGALRLLVSKLQQIATNGLTSS